jgi:hypothetical protein
MVSSLADLATLGLLRQKERQHPLSAAEFFSLSPAPGEVWRKEHRLYQLTQYEITDKIAGGTLERTQTIIG